MLSYRYFRWRATKYDPIAGELVTCCTWTIPYFYSSLITANRVTAPFFIPHDDDDNDDIAVQVTIAEKHGVAYLYIICACTTLLALIFVCAYVPETKGV